MSLETTPLVDNKTSSHEPAAERTRRNQDSDLEANAQRTNYEAINTFAATFVLVLILIAFLAVAIFALGVIMIGIYFARYMFHSFCMYGRALTRM